MCSQESSGGHVDSQELLAKLAQIEEQAKLTLSDVPKTLTRERLRTRSPMKPTLGGKAVRPSR